MGRVMNFALETYAVVGVVLVMIGLFIFIPIIMKRGEGD